MRTVFTALATLALLATSAAANDRANVLNEAIAATRYWEHVEPLNDGWAFFESDQPDAPAADDDSAVPVTIPHTWNAHDTLAAKQYRRAGAWYRRSLTLTRAETQGRLYLRFKAAGTHAEVYVNGALATTHLGGYTAFVAEISSLVHPGDNTIDVHVSNAEREDLPPLDIDHNIYGGIYRGVQLIRGPTLGLSRLENGGPGVRAISENVTPESATLRVRAVIDNAQPEANNVTLVAELTDAAGRAVSFAQTSLAMEPGRRPITLEMPDVVRPDLWSPSSPSLYTLRVTLWDDRNIVDTVTVDHGFRFYEFDPDEGFSLNGEHVFLKGVNRHQDVYRRGPALEAEDHLRDIRMIKDMGANALRLAHYPQDDVVLALCDRLGLIVWEEIPLVNKITPDEPFAENTLAMLREMITQHAHHPSIVTWGIQNELLIRSQNLVAEKRALMVRLNEAAHEADPTRPTVMAAHGIKGYLEGDLTSVTDLIGYNVYYGWYSETFPDLTRIITEFRDGQPDRPHMISEFGAGSDLRVQRADPKRQDFSEQWQCAMIESYLDQAEEIPWLAGVFYWNMFDFGASHRGDTIPGVNQKGLVTFDRQVKKDAYFLVRSRWSDEPTLYLASPRLTHYEGDAERVFKVYTNLDHAELFHNGHSLGKQSTGFAWTVRLDEGPNTLHVTAPAGAEEHHHGYTVTYTPTKDTE